MIEGSPNATCIAHTLAISLDLETVLASSVPFHAPVGTYPILWNAVGRVQYVIEAIRISKLICDSVPIVRCQILLGPRVWPCHDAPIIIGLDITVLEDGRLD